MANQYTGDHWCPTHGHMLCSCYERFAILDEPGRMQLREKYEPPFPNWVCNPFYMDRPIYERISTELEEDKERIISRVLLKTRGIEAAYQLGYGLLCAIAISTAIFGWMLGRNTETNCTEGG